MSLVWASIISRRSWPQRSDAISFLESHYQNTNCHATRCHWRPLHLPTTTQQNWPQTQVTSEILKMQSEFLASLILHLQVCSDNHTLHSCSILGEGGYFDSQTTDTQFFGLPDPYPAVLCQDITPHGLHTAAENGVEYSSTAMAGVINHPSFWLQKYPVWQTQAQPIKDSMARQRNGIDLTDSWMAQTMPMANCGQCSQFWSAMGLAWIILHKLTSGGMMHHGKKSTWLILSASNSGLLREPKCLPIPFKGNQFLLACFSPGLYLSWHRQSWTQTWWEYESWLVWAVTFCRQWNY